MLHLSASFISETIELSKILPSQRLVNSVKQGSPWTNEQDSSYPQNCVFSENHFNFRQKCNGAWMQTEILHWLLQRSHLCSVLQRTVAAHQCVSLFFHSIFNLPLKEIKRITTRESGTRGPNSSPAPWYLAVRGNRTARLRARVTECCTSNGTVCFTAKDLKVLHRSQSGLY